MIRLNKLSGTLAFVLMSLFSSLTSYAAEYLVPAWDVFGGAQIDNNGNFTVLPGDSGFAARGDKNLVFSEAGQITVNATVPAGEDVTLRFVFQDLPNPNNTVDYTVLLPLDDTTQVEGSSTYVIEVPAREDEQSFTNVVLFVEDSIDDDSDSVAIADVSISHNGSDQNGTGENSSYTILSGNWSAFEGTVIDENGYLVFPTLNPNPHNGTEEDPDNPWVNDYAGFECSDSLATPVTFLGGGSISFEASVPSGGSVGVFFRIEEQPYPNNNTYVDTDTQIISGSSSTTYTLDIPTYAADYNSVTDFNNIILYIVPNSGYHNIPLELGNVTISDDAYIIPSDTPPASGVQFRFENEAYPNNRAILYSPWVSIDSYTPQSYQITMPAYDGSLSGIAATYDFVNSLLYFSGNVPILIRDIQIDVGDTTFGGVNDDTLLYGNIFGGLQFNEDTLTFNLPSGAQSWAGAALKNNVYVTDENGQQVLTSDWFGAGTKMNEEITISFVAALSEEEFAPPPSYSGESAFDSTDGSINTSAPSETGESGDELRWSGWVTKFELGANEEKGGWLEDLNWGRIEDLPATWSDVDGESILTLAPNTNNFNAWSDTGATDGKFYLDQILRLEGTAGTSALLGSTVNFQGTIESYTLDPKYTVTAFIRTIDTSITGSSQILDAYSITVPVDANTGQFRISTNIPEGETLIPSLGFVLEGRNTSEFQDYGNIQIKDLVANFTPTSSITNGNFSTPNSYWTAGAGTFASFDITDGNGAFKGQAKVISNGERGTKYIVSKGGTPELLEDFGIAAGNIYDLTFYMNRSGLQTDMGYAEVVFYDTDGTAIPASSDPSEYNHPASDGTWTQATQEVIVPGNAVSAVIKLYGGSSGTAIAFDDVYLTYVSAANTFDVWASNNNLSNLDAGFNADPDNDGIENGLENFFGTLPGTPSSGMTGLVYDNTTNSVSMQHPKNSDVSSDVEATYYWSTDLTTWIESGSEFLGNQVDITVVDDTPASGVSTATADIISGDIDSLFIKVVVNQSND